jgi:hypothetical protein
MTSMNMASDDWSIHLPLLSRFPLLFQTPNLYLLDTCAGDMLIVLAGLLCRSSGQ